MGRPVILEKYPYTYLRAIIMKKALLNKSDYDKILKMTPDQIGKYLEDFEYKKEVDELEEVEKRLKNIEELVILGENDPAFARASANETEKEIEEIKKVISDLEFKILFSEEYDRNDAIVTLMSGAGG